MSSDSVEVMHSLQMNNILFYVIFSRHTDFVCMLIYEMIHHTIKHYTKFKTTITCLESLLIHIKKKTLPHNHVVVLFFFFLSIDVKMRHWILNTQQNQEDIIFRDKMLKRNLKMAIGAGSSLSKNINNPFLGQSVVFSPLNPHAAVSILLQLTQEDFFMPIISEQDANAIDTVFTQIKSLVILA